MFVKEEAGQLFGDIALAISAAVLLSLVVSVLVVPVAAAWLLGTARPSVGGAADPVALVRALAVPVRVTLDQVLVTLVQGRSEPVKDALQRLAECGSVTYEREFLR